MVSSRSGYVPGPQLAQVLGALPASAQVAGFVPFASFALAQASAAPVIPASRFASQLPQLLASRRARVCRAPQGSAWSLLVVLPDQVSPVCVPVML